MSEKMENYEQVFMLTFRELRKKEGLNKSKLLEFVGAYFVAQVLINRRWKYKNNKAIEHTDLEDLLADEMGYFVLAYTAELEKNGKFSRDQIPYPDANITIAELCEWLGLKDIKQLIK